MTSYRHHGTTLLLLIKSNLPAERPYLKLGVKPSYFDSSSSSTLHLLPQFFIFHTSSVLQWSLLSPLYHLW